MTGGALHFEDLAGGQVFESGPYHLSREAIIAFAREYDPQPMHLSDDGAARTMFKTLAASGWQITAITMRLMAEAKPFGSTPLIGVQINDLRFTRPVYPNAALHVRAEITAMEPSSRPERGYAVIDVKTRDARTDTVVLTQTWRMLLPRRV